MRNIIRKSAESGRPLYSYVAHLEDRLDAVMRAQSQLDLHGRVDLHVMLSEGLRTYLAMEGDDVSLPGPEVHLKAKAGQTLALVVHELAVNAIEHGSLGAGVGNVHVSWDIQSEGSVPRLALDWQETGGLSGQPSTEGFGTDVLTRMIGYELRATSRTQFPPAGLHYELRLPLTDQVWFAES